MPFITPFFSDGTVAEEFPAPFLDHWETLALTTNQADPLSSAPPWNLAIQKISHPGQRLLYLENNSGILVLNERLVDDGLLFSLDDQWGFGSSLLGPDSPALLAEALEMLARLGTRVKRIFLGGVRPDSGFADSLAMRLDPSFGIWWGHPLGAVGSASLENGLDGWLGRRSANTRAKLKKARRKSAGAGIWFERVIPETPEAALKIYDRMIDVERRSWKGIGHCGMAEEPAIRFYRELLLMNGRQARVIFAKFGLLDIGFIFGNVLGRVYRGQQFSYDQGFAEFSLGNLMQFETVSWLCETGCLRYGMGPVTGNDRMAYKSHWAEAATPYRALHIFKR